MKFLLKTPLRGGHLLLGKEVLNKSQIIGVFSNKARIPAGLGLKLPENKKSWILTNDNKVYFAKKNSRYVIQSQ